MSRWCVWAGVGIAAFMLGACDAGRGIVRSIEERPCREESVAERWEQAAAACKKAVEREDRSDEVIILAARALQNLQKPDEALAMAKRGFGTSVDATARRIAGAVREQLDDSSGAQLLLAQAVIAHHLAGNHAELAMTEHAFVGWFRDRRRLSEALDAANQMLDRAKLAKDDRLIGMAHRDQGKALTDLGDAMRARDAYFAAESELRDWPQDLVWALLWHGMLLNDVAKPGDAVKLLTDSLELAMQQRIARVPEAAHLNLAEAERARGDTVAAQRHLDAVSPKSRERTGPKILAGKLAADRGDLVSAERLLAAAAVKPSDEDFAWDIAYQRGLVAEKAGDPTSAAHFYRDAIIVVDRIRKRTEEFEIRPWVLASRRNPYEALFVLLASLQQDSDALAIAEQLNAQAWLDALVSSADPRDRQALESASPALRPTEEVFSTIGDREVLIYVNASGRLWRIHVDGGAIVELVQVGAEVGPLVASWSNPDDAEKADRLGALLLPGKLAASGRPLYLVTPDKLADVPFAALRRSQRYLIADRTLVRLPGLAALRCPRHENKLGAVLFADSLAERPLVRAREEIQHVQRVTGGEAFVGAAATISQVMRARRAAILHVAVHGDIDAAAGGALLFADGRLTASDIIVHGLAPRVAVLAGCSTGASNDVGWGSLPSALLIAGTRSVVATLRPVFDADAALVMSAFYDEHGDRDPVAALARAQRTLSSSSQPHVWAWFAAWGLAEPDCPER